MTAHENGRPLAEALGTPVVTSEGAIPTGDDCNLVDDGLDAVAHESLVDRIVAKWQTWRAGNEASAESLDRMREADGMDVESDPIDPEGELCSECGQYPATYRSKCFGCGARAYIAIRQGIA